MKRNQCKVVAIILVFVLLFSSCSNSNKKDKKWLDKFFDFAYQGNEDIELRIEGNTYAAKVVLPKETVDSFLSIEKDSIESVKDDFDYLEQYLSMEQMVPFSDFVNVKQENLDYWFLKISAAISPIDGAGTTRGSVIIVLKPEEGMVTLYAIADLIYLD